jgi:glycosyltransferase involved in cell wall biosynthesis
MALGTPVVATPKGAAGLEVVDGEHLLLAADPPTFARHTLSLLQDPARRAQLAARARRLVEERYDWRAIGARFVEAVERSVAEKARSAR